MNSYNNVVMVIKESFRLQSPSFNDMVGQHLLHPSKISHKTKFQFELLCKTLCDFITDPVQTPDTIIHLLYHPKLPWLFCGRDFRNVVALFCLRALAKRMPVFEGSWERLLYVIIKFSEDIDYDHSPITSKADPTDVIWLKGIQNLCSPEKCPNPCLRLELIRRYTLYIYYFCKYDYDNHSVRELVIHTLYEIHNMYSFLTLDQMYMTAEELGKTLLEYSLDIRSIIQKDQPKSKQIKIIGALIKISGMYAHLEKERGRKRTNVDSSLFACSAFLGLIKYSEDTWNAGKHFIYISYIVRAVYDKPILLDYVIDTISAINNADSFLSVKSYHEGEAINLHSRLRDMIVHMFFKQYINNLPMHHNLREVNGGITTATERRVRYFSSNVRPYIAEAYNSYIKSIANSISIFSEDFNSGEDFTDFSEYDSEESFSEEEECEEIDSGDGTEEDSEDFLSGEDDSEEVDSGEDVSEEDSEDILSGEDDSEQFDSEGF